MRLINVDSGKLEVFHDQDIPKYAILSHTWGPDEEEISFQDIQGGYRSKRGAGKAKLDGLCKYAKADGLEYAWIDTCCIDKTNSTELGEAINSMFRWYQEASVCYAFLADVSDYDRPTALAQLRSSRWFTRGWTLQELLAPKRLMFYNKDWQPLGWKHELAGVVAEITSIPRGFLLGFVELQKASVAQRMSWAARRITKRREDNAYSLLGIFGVMLPMIYGEGGNAFIRLQEEIIRSIKDDSVLAWCCDHDAVSDKFQDTSANLFGDVLAASPANFEHSGTIVPLRNTKSTIEALGVSGGYLHLRLVLHATEVGQEVGLLNCCSEDQSDTVVGIPLCQKSPKEASDEYIRPKGSKALLLSRSDSGVLPKLVRIHRSLHFQDSRSHNRRYGFHIEQPTGKELEVIDAYPTDRWEDNGVICIPVDARYDAIHRTWVKIRHTNTRYQDDQDFVMALEVGIKNAQPQASCHVMVASRSTTLHEIAHISTLTKCLFGEQRASNHSYNLQAILTQERSGSDLYVITLVPLSGPSPITINANDEQEILDCTTHLQRLFETNQNNGMVLSRLDDAISIKRSEIARRYGRLGSEQKDISQSKGDESQPPPTPSLDGTLQNLQELEHLKKKRKDLAADLAKNTKSIYEKISSLSDSFGCKRASQWRKTMAAHFCNTLPPTNHPNILGIPDIIRRAFMQAVAGGHKVAMLLLFSDFRSADFDFEDTAGNGVLSTVINNGHHLLLKSLLKKGLKGYKGLGVNHIDSWGLAPISRAALTGCFCSTVEVLLDQGAHIETKDEEGRTPLFLAAFGNHTTVVQVLLERGADAREKNKDDWSPLSIAAKRGNVEIAKLLLDYGAEIETTNGNKRTPLMLAVRQGHHDITSLLIDRGADIKTQDDGGCTPLALASREGYHNIVKQILDKSPETGAILEVKNEYGRSPLALAAQNGHKIVAKLLLDRGANLEAKCTSGRSPLSLAVSEGHEEVVQLFLKKGAALESKDDRDETPLMLAVRYAHERIARLLITQGADIEAREKTNATPLVLAATFGYKEVAALLLIHGANIEARDSNGETALFDATRGNYISMMSLLLDRGADVDAKGDHEESPLFLAIRNCHKAAAQLLLSKGADTSGKSSNGLSPLEYARSFISKAEYIEGLQGRRDLVQVFDGIAEEAKREDENLCKTYVWPKMKMKKKKKKKKKGFLWNLGESSAGHADDAILGDAQRGWESMAVRKKVSSSTVSESSLAYSFTNSAACEAVAEELGGTDTTRASDIESLSSGVYVERNDAAFSEGSSSTESEPSEA